MKTQLKKSSKQTGSSFANGYQRKQSAQAEFEDKRDSSAVQNSVMQDVDNSPMMTMQRKQLEPSFGNPVQRQAEEEELLQGKFSQPLQRQELEEEELLQGKFSEPVQRVEEEEELLQGKFSQPVRREQEGAAAPRRMA